MELKKNIIEMACSRNACTSGIDKLMLASHQQEFIDLYFSYIDFCLARKVPSNDFIKKHFGKDLLIANGIYIDKQEISVNNPKRTAVVGESNLTLNFDDYAVGRVYVADNSTATINAGRNAFVVMDCVDKSKLTVNIYENAKVIVNAYAGAKVSGNGTIIRKNTPTYVLN